MPPRAWYHRFVEHATRLGISHTAVLTRLCLFFGLHSIQHTSCYMLMTLFSQDHLHLFFSKLIPSLAVSCPWQIWAPLITFLASLPNTAPQASSCLRNSMLSTFSNGPTCFTLTHVAPLLKPFISSILQENCRWSIFISQSHRRSPISHFHHIRHLIYCSAYLFIHAWSTWAPSSRS